MILIDGENLSIEDVVSVAQFREKASLTPQAKEKIKQSHKWINEIIKEGKPIYGINTGFGVFSNKHIPIEDIKKLNRNLILSHAVGTGPDLPEEVVRGAILIRANTLASGYSGIRLELVENLLQMLNQGVIPIIPSQGSLGSSGDLAPLSHLALVLTTDEQDSEENSGWATYDGKRVRGKTAMKEASIKRLILGPKEGLAITNGATFSAALAALIISGSETLLDTAEVCLAMSLEAMLGCVEAFDKRLHASRNQEGQISVASRIRELTQGSTLLGAANRIQDAYSLRCAPQVQGPARDTIKFVYKLIIKEINAATDNPLIFGPGDTISGGNFHGEVIGMAMDFLKIAISEVAAISERRTFLLTDSKMNSGLPPMLVDSAEAAGLNSGMMMPHYTAASLVLENQHLSNPDSIYSLPTSGGKEDHNANALTAARHAYQVIQNCAHVLAIEIFIAARALDFRLREEPEKVMGIGVSKAHQIIRETIPLQLDDTLWGPQIEEIREMVTSGKLLILI